MNQLRCIIQMNGLLLAIIVLYSCKPINVVQEQPTEHFVEFKEIYIDESGQRISQAEFEYIQEEAYNLWSSTKYDTLIISELHFREHFGTLELTQLDKFKTEFIESIQRHVDLSQNLCLEFKVNKNQSFEYCDDNVNQLTKNEVHNNSYQILHRQIAKTNLSTATQYLIDKDDVLKRYFFSNKLSCSNWLVIKPNGEYRTFIGSNGAEICFDMENNWDSQFISTRLTKLYR